ncbi:olfactory receptor 7D4-like [Elephas maximus indicus]|uniref:olfactory receptor 7D4-like n=1 Tax=Elephas maximus indicus TaxID=99487 RepID=UPI0021169011|nr:olfactory receptor 7D4-like [Elephas maximus indicus]
MEPKNLTDVSEFLLLGLSEDPELQPLLFGLFLSMYLITVTGNLLIILAVTSDSHLHTPMYFFLSNLSLTDISVISTTVLKMLVNIQTHSKSITYAGCLTQVSFFYLFICLDSLLLTVMAYDRISSLGGKYKAFSTCGSHLTVVCLYYGTGLGVYFSSAATSSSRMCAVSSVMYTVVTPMLNPFIYSLRNRDIKKALWRLLSRSV